MTITAPGTDRPSAGSLLRQWRERRGLSQLELAGRAGLSQRHLSFVENDRSAPSRDLVLRLADRLELALRERDRLLMAAGFAPVYGERDLESPGMSAVRNVVRQLLRAHEPNPAIVVDRRWNRVHANDAANVFVVGVADELREEPVNVLRFSLHPHGMAPRIVNLGEWRAHLLHRLRGQVRATGDPDLAELEQELLGYPCDQYVPDLELPGPGELAVPLKLRFEEHVLSFFCTVSTFGTPLDVTVSELVIESFFAADPETTKVLADLVW